MLALEQVTVDPVPEVYNNSVMTLYIRTWLSCFFKMVVIVCAMVSYISFDMEVYTHIYLGSSILTASVAT